MPELWLFHQLQRGPIVRAVLIMFILELAGAFSLIFGFFTLRQSQANFSESEVTQATVERQTEETQKEVSSLILYVNNSQQSSQAFADLLSAQCTLLVVLAQRSGETVPDQIVQTCKPFKIPTVLIPTPSPRPGGHP